MLKYCPFCKTDVKTASYPEDGTVVCVSCYGILEQNQMVSDVTFVESGGGRKGVIGEIVKTRGKSDEYNWAGREMLISTVTETMRSFAELINIRDSDTLDFGIRVYKLALEKKFVKGRPRDISVAISLYIACRMQKRPVMLIDLSEILRRDVFLLGHAYYQMVKLLQLKLPLIDPALYLERFASQLDFGDKFYDVVRTAAKLASRMNRDWMIQGRRPAGISAAALIISSRVHGFMRTNEEVMTVVRMSSSTVQKRLDEFLLTSASNLTPDQFEVKSEIIKDELDPPIFSQRVRAFTYLEPVKDETNTDSEERVNNSQSTQVSVQQVETQQTENVIEINEEDVRAVNALFDQEEIQELDEDFREDETNTWSNYRFEISNKPEINNFVFFEDEVEEDNISTDDEIEKMIVNDDEFNVRKSLWNHHFGNIEREIQRKRRERAIMDEGRATKRKKTDNEVSQPWDAETAEESTHEMLQRITSSASRAELFDSEINFKPKKRAQKKREPRSSQISQIDNREIEEIDFGSF